MDGFDAYLANIENPQHRERLAEVLTWVSATFPHLQPRIAWNQPMFTDHGTFIIGFSVAKHHFAVAPEKAGIERFAGRIREAGYSLTQQLFRIKWDQPVHYDLLKEIIAFNIADKADCMTFWRKEA